MIVFEKVSMTVTTYYRTRTILSPTNLVIPSNRRIALLGPSVEDKTILVNLLSGLILPRSGRIIRKARVSFPVGYLGGFERELPVRKNVAHLARLYDADVQALVNFVERVADLGSSFDKPYGLLTGYERSYLARIVGYSIPFDLYVLNNAVGRSKKNSNEDISRDMFEARSRTAGMIIPTRSPKFAREYCDMGLVLQDGQLQLYDRIEEALVASEEAE